MSTTYEHIPGRYGVTVTRTEHGTSTRVPLEPSLAAPDGSLRLAAVLMAIDMGSGLTAGAEVLPKWTVTADIETRLVGRCTVGPLRVDSRSIKPGRTMSVVESRVVDEGADDTLVALSTANHGVLEPTFDGSHEVAVGDLRVFTPPPDPGPSLEAYFGVEIHEGGAGIEIDERTRNPWGILHGGLTGLLMDVTARGVGIAEPTDLVVRYLRAVQHGPARTRIVETVDRPGGRLVKVEMVDVGTGKVAATAIIGGPTAS